MRTPKFYVGDLVYDTIGRQAIVVKATQTFCSYCLDNSGPYHYSVHPCDDRGMKHAWYEGKELTLHSRHARLKASPPKRG